MDSNHKQLRLLIVEDSATDAELLVHTLTRHGYELDWHRVDNAQALRQALTQSWDAVISDYRMPGFSWREALTMLRQGGHKAPFFIVSGSVGEELAVESLREGVNDFFLKDNLRRLPPALERELQETKMRAEREQARRELEQSEERLRAIFQQVVVGIAQVSPDERFVLANQRFCEFLGRSMEEVVGASVRDVLPLPELCEPQSGPESAFSFTRPDGSVLWLHCNVSKLAGQGKIYLIQDLTRQKQAERELQRTVELSELFVSVLGHDLRNPLTAILTAAQLLRATYSVPVLERLMRSAVRMQRLIDQLLDFSRMRRGEGMPLELAELDLSSICHSAIEEAVSEEERQQVVLEVCGDTRGHWDRDRLSQLISNLISNAVTHRAEGSEVRVRVDGQRAQEVVLEFHNLGTIRREVLPKLFQQIPSAGPGSWSGSSGLGLGLYISHEIVRRHGGQIGVETSAEKGTTFRVVLPRISVAPPPQNATGP